MAPGGTNESAIDDRDAKHLLDSIGRIIQEEVHESAKEFRDYLKGNLQNAKGSDEITAYLDTCQLIEDYYNPFRNDEKRHSCGTGTERDKRFSKERDAECDDKKIEDNDSNCGACAPLRRLTLCNKNLQQIKQEKITTNNLLAEVCLAAKYEGESLRNYSAQYDEQYKGSNHTMCTMLARSFADIGDIVRGRDLYHGNKRRSQKDTERQKLEKKIIEYFGEIYNNLTQNGHKKEEAERKYKRGAPNYYELREDWWDANRATIWEAITCSANKNTYFRASCNGPSVARDKCRCNGMNADPPTFFDYVPQFLRWFEEWAEDFCRKRNKKLTDAIKKCRGDDGSGNDRYCDLNGYDCKKTYRGRKKYHWDYKCTGCFLSCSHFRTWIDNQRKQFLKQKRKYTKEMEKHRNEGDGDGTMKRRQGATGSEDYRGYEKKFYNKLKREKNYGSVDEFLGLLNKETTCQNKGNNDEETVNFININMTKDGEGDGENKTFSHTEYCLACPWCGVGKEGNKWQRWEEDSKCPRIKLYKPIPGEKGTNIKILTSGDGPKDINKKLEAFCKETGGNNDGDTHSVRAAHNDGRELYEAWQCYQVHELQKDEVGEDDNEYNEDVENGGGLCILGEEKNNKEENQMNSRNNRAQMQKTFNNFFNFWVTHMINDSIQWREKLKRCIENKSSNKCKRGCKEECECYERWIGKKKGEWAQIKKYFDQQPNIGGEGYMFKFTPYYILESVLEGDEFFTGISEAYGDPQQIRKIKELFERRKTEVEDKNIRNEETILDKLLDHELEDAQKCKQCEDPKKPITNMEDRSRADHGTPKVVEKEEDGESSSESEGEEDEEEEELTSGEHDKNNEKLPSPPDPEGEPKEEGEVSQEPSAKENICDIVGKALEVDNLKAACPTKYGPKSPTNWKCVPATKPGSDTAAPRTRFTRQAGDTKSGTDQGSICIPPRRRRLYIEKIKDWAKTVVGVEASSVHPGSGEATMKQSSQPLVTTSGAPTEPHVALRDAFIQSAAIETYFLWHNFKEQKKGEKKEEVGAGSNVLLGEASQAGEKVEKELQEQLEGEGKIPDDFKRQMFYTLGDYRDICIGDESMIKTLKDSGDKNKTSSGESHMEKIEKAITTFFEQNPGTPRTPGSGNQQTEREKFWKDHGKNIWKGMVCALTYKENGNQAPQKDDNLFRKFFGDPPGERPDTDGGTYEETYKYENVKLDAVEEGGAKAAGDAPNLDAFVKRPFFFRWLEEWGNEFFRKMTHSLGIIKVDCRGKNGDKPCSGDGLPCYEEVPENNKIYEGFLCRSCSNSCRSYRKWIERKKDEFEKQKKAYERQKEICAQGRHIAISSNDGIAFCEKVQTYTAVKDFLHNLNGDPCKNSDDIEGRTVDFNNEDKTFGPSPNCESCSQFTVKCKNGNCMGDGTILTCSAGKIKAPNILHGADSFNELDMRVSDRTETTIPSGLEACQHAGIFKGIKEKKYKCAKICGVDICTLKKEYNNAAEDDTKYIIMKEFLKRWLEYFFEDYNRINKKLKICIEKKNGSTCINECVTKWINLKKEEWKKIREDYLNKYTIEDPEGNNLGTSLSDGPFYNDVLNAIKPCKGISAFMSKHCNGSETLQKEKVEKKDIVQCLMENLEKEVKNCPNQPNGEHTTCENTYPTPLEDEEEPLEEEENQVTPPQICENVVDTKTQLDETGDACTSAEAPEEPASPVAGTEDIEPGSGDVGGDGGTDDSNENTRVSEDENNPVQNKDTHENQIPSELPKEETKQDESETESREEETKSKDGPKDKAQDPSKKRGPPPPPKPQLESPQPKLRDVLLPSAFPWTVGVAFVALTYWALLKRKPKPPVKLFTVLDIPKGDFDMPTNLSSNRYIPYGTRKHRGKGYIYIEGDTDEEKYIGDITSSDITSSSESEYEELDLHVPSGPPKYKTLIEVVLEPSKRETNSGDHIPSDNTPTNKPINDEEWNKLKDEFISNMLQKEQNTEPTPSDNNVDNNTHPTPSHVSMDEKPFIISIHDRNLYTGEEYIYDMSTNSGNNDSLSGNLGSYGDRNDPLSDENDSLRDNNVSYSGIDLVNDALSSNRIDIYDEMLKRKENELFGTQHHPKKNTYSVAKPARNDPVLNQLELFHKWLDRHRDMCEKWGNKVEMLDKLKELWDKDYISGDNIHSDNITSDIPNGKLSDIPNGKLSDTPSGKNVLNSDVSIQIDMDNPKPTNGFSNMDTYTVKYTVENNMNPNLVENPNPNHQNPLNNAQIEVSVNNREMMKEKYPISDMWDI
ncbi:erythrocyte membrane protein 1, PfEMP1, putative [Plasmodium sp. DRC-Itaito]|nr:erythrocyte membrane protein 1, PfEMP1, putative [Plasmodium sp. DRC-Itaito]